VPTMPWRWDRDREMRLAAVGLAVVLAIAAAFLIWEDRGLTLLIDEWNFGYAARTNLDLSTFFAPHNGHFVAVPVFIDKAALQVFGISGALPLRLFAVAVHLAVAGCLYLLLRRPLSPLAALAPATLFLFLGSANDAIIGSHGLAISIAVLTGLAAWMALDRHERAWDVAAAALLTIGIGCSAYALPFTIGAVAVLALDPKMDRKRFWVVAVPLIVYAIWWLLEGRKEGEFVIAAFGALPSFLFDSLGAALAAITGLFSDPGSRTPTFDIPASQALAGAFIGILLTLILKWRYRPPRAVIPPLAALLCFWLLTAGAASALRQPDSSRYLYVSVPLLLLVLAQMIAASSVRRQATVALAAICIFSLLPNIREMTYGASFFREQSDISKAVFGAANMLAGRAPANTPLETPEDLAGKPIPYVLPQPLEKYVAARERFGAPAFSASQISVAPVNARFAADRLLARALAIQVRPTGRVPRALPAGLEAFPTGGSLSLTRNGGCLRFVPTSAGAQMTMPLPPGGIWIRPEQGTAVPIAVRRFTEAFEIQIGPALAGRPSEIVLPRAGPPAQDWQVQLTPAQPVLLCAPRGQ
jgi:hypothetical protein